MMCTNGVLRSAMPIPDVNPELVEIMRSGQLQGSSVTTFLRVLCAHCPSITELRFRTYSLTPGLSERLKTRETNVPDWLSRAEESARNSETTLWDALAKAVIRHSEQLPREVFVEALAHHHSDLERTFILTRQEVLEGGIDFVQTRLDADEGLALCSELRILDGYAVHIPMLDFACATTEANRATISMMLDVIGQTGVLANSGNSYHFIGISFLRGDEWIRFMGRALLLAPFVDVRFMGHRLFDGECRLRIFARHKAPQVPSIEMCVHPTLTPPTTDFWTK